MHLMDNNTASDQTTGCKQAKTKTQYFYHLQYTFKKRHNFNLAISAKLKKKLKKLSFDYTEHGQEIRKIKGSVHEDQLKYSIVS